MFTTRVRFAGLAAVAAGALLLTGCSGEGDAPSPSPTLTHQGPTVAPTPTPMPTVGNLDDPLCAAAVESIKVSADVLTKSDELTELVQDPSFITSGDPEVLNAWGEEMSALTEQSLVFYDVGVAETQGDPINEDFVAMQSFITNYTAPLAKLAAEATSAGVFLVQVSTIVTDAETREVLTAAPAAAQRIGEYVAERCGPIG